jgi:hypothetical protein
VDEDAAEALKAFPQDQQRIIADGFRAFTDHIACVVLCCAVLCCAVLCCCINCWVCSPAGRCQLCSSSLTAICSAMLPAGRAWPS